MKPLHIISFYLLVIILITLLLYSYIFKSESESESKYNYLNINFFLLLWVIIGIVIIVYVGYIIIHRYEMKPLDSNINYWDNDSYDLLSSSVWIDGYRDYMTQLDDRYFDPMNSNVYFIELVNLIFTAGIIISVIPPFCSIFLLKTCLLGQILISVYYLWTIPKIINMSITRVIEFVYFGISSIWVVYPLLLIIILMYSNYNKQCMY